MELLKILKLNKKEKAFTIVEVLITIVILVMLVGSGLLFSISFYKSYDLRAERDILLGILTKSRNQAMNNIDESKHGVYLGNKDYLIFEGNNYLDRDQSKDDIINSNSSINRSGLTEVVFDQLNGDSSASGTIVLSDGNRFLNISINLEGRIDW